MRRVAQIMGMPITVDIPDCKDEAVFDDIFNLFRKVDERFSPFKKDSEFSSYRRGEVPEKTLSTEMKAVIKACKEAEEFTKGYFSAWYSDKFNPSGYVKGWAIKRAGDLLKKKGFKTFCIGAGGDILASSSSQKKWRIGLQDPTDRQKILNVLSISSGAVATSGTYERGDHIINPKTGKPTKELLSISVVGPDIITADILATAAFAMGKKGIDFIEKQDDYEALAVDDAGAIFTTTRF
ncbi:MAG TPA: FAD:protein FMN transferase [Candidatus Saccharimonadales bacterium]|nr:FAD:protein FMN transferase [Candidatus Saccharimonadales bacterium]